MTIKLLEVVYPFKKKKSPKFGPLKLFPDHTDLTPPLFWLDVT